MMTIGNSQATTTGTQLSIAILTTIFTMMTMMIMKTFALRIQIIMAHTPLHTHTLSSVVMRKYWCVCVSVSTDPLFVQSPQQSVAAAALAWPGLVLVLVVVEVRSASYNDDTITHHASSDD